MPPPLSTCQAPAPATWTFSEAMLDVAKLARVRPGSRPDGGPWGDCPIMAQ